MLALLTALNVAHMQNSPLKMRGFDRQTGKRGTV
jgi:hypothetical protein